MSIVKLKKIYLTSSLLLCNTLLLLLVLNLILGIVFFVEDQAALKEISHCWPKISIRISAQDYLQVFYERYGFIRVSEVYPEDGIPRVEMMKEARL